MKLSVLLLSLALAGCATAPQQASRPTARDDPSWRCFASLVDDSRFDALRPKMPANVKSLSLEQLASTERASEQDKRLLSIFAVARQTCIEMGEQFRRTYAPPGWNEIFHRAQARIFDALADLYAGNITYGEYNRKRRQTADQTEQEFAENDRRSQERAAAERQTAINNYLLFKSLETRPAPAVDCETRFIGSAAYTSCR